MAAPDFDAINEQLNAMFACLPLGFGESLPPKLRLRYINLLSDIRDLAKRITRFQAHLAGQTYRPPRGLLGPGLAQSPPVANWRKLDDAFQAIQHALPGKYVDALPDEHQIPYLRIRQQHAHLRAKSLRLGEALQRQGLV